MKPRALWHAEPIHTGPEQLSPVLGVPSWDAVTKGSSRKGASRGAWELPPRPGCCSWQCLVAVLGHSVHRPATFARHFPSSISWGRAGLGYHVSTLCCHRPSLLPSHNFLPDNVLTHLLSHSCQELSRLHLHSSCFSPHHSQKFWIFTFLSAPHHFPAQLSHQPLHPVSPFLSMRIIIAPHGVRRWLFSILPSHITSVPAVALSESPRVTISTF